MPDMGGSDFVIPHRAGAVADKPDIYVQGLRVQVQSIK
jgi:hypothetical protein